MNSLVPSTKIERASTATTRGTRVCGAARVLVLRPNPGRAPTLSPC